MIEPEEPIVPEEDEDDSFWRQDAPVYEEDDRDDVA